MTDVQAAAADWLTQEFKIAESRYRELPEWATPVYVPPDQDRETRPRVDNDVVCG